MRRCALMLALATTAIVLRAQGQPSTTVRPESRSIAGFSIVGWDSVTGDLGVAVESDVLGVGGIVPFAKAGVGAIATQARANSLYGREGLRMMEQGLSPQFVIEGLTKPDSAALMRQVGMVDAQGNAYAFTGSACRRYAGHIAGRGYSVQASAVTGDAVLRAMANTFELTSGTLADRLLSALEAGETAGGTQHGIRSAALLVVRDEGGFDGTSDRYIDLRVDDHASPLAELRRIYMVWQQTSLFDAEMRSIETFNRKNNFAAARQMMVEIVSSINALLKEKPDDPGVLNTVAWTMATNNIDNVRALDLAKRAAKLDPQNLDYLNTLAECHFRVGNYDEAIAIESQLVSKDPANDAYWKQLQKFKEGKASGAK